ncbi:MAG: NAD(P)/FAD-dependent oxidoreductase [Nitrospirae bacterium]|nr:NAD(P)/FAD-dependent oxidoreductase [Nitrospirota bacterium]
MATSAIPDLDVLVIGAGPNGLACAAYLARAGGKVAVVEKNVESGGGLLTQEISGFKLNHHATYMMLAERMIPYADLNLADRGVAFVRPEAQAAFLFKDKSSFTLYTDVKKSQESIARLSAKDAEAYGRLHDEFQRMCDAFLIPATYAPPVEPLEQVELLQNADQLGKVIADISECSPLEVINRYKFSDRRVKAGVLYLASMFGLDPEESGMGFMAPIYVHRLTQNALVRGGSHQLASGLRRTVEESGGRVITNSQVQSFVLENGRVVGIRLRDGELRARAVVSTLNPLQTFSELLPAMKDGELKEMAEEWQWDEWSLFVCSSGVVGQAPLYEGYAEEANRALVVVMGFDSAEDVLQHAAELREGKLPETIAGHGSCLSLFDPLLAPNHVPFGEHHVLRWECWAPYREDWEGKKEPFADKCMETWARYAPNIRMNNVRVRIPWSPLDIEREIPTMKRGAIKHGAYVTLQMGYNRPSPDCSGYRTPIPGLYVAGASAHPGGMVILGPGYNAARVVAADLSLGTIESDDSSVAEARQKGYLPPLNTPSPPAGEGKGGGGDRKSSP